MPKFATNPLGTFGRLQSTHIAVDEERCISVRNRNATCARCAEACTSGCISLAPDGIAIDQERCIGCGTCATVCPTCALSARHPSDEELLAACERALANTGGEACICCRERYAADRAEVDGARVVPVVCLGRVEEGLALSLVAAGAFRVTLVAGACETCPHARGLACAHAVRTSANALLAAWGSEARVRVVDAFPDAVRASRAPGASARPEPVDGIARAARLAFETPRPTPPAAPARFARVMRDKTLPHHVPDRRRRVVEALGRIGAPGAYPIDVRLWGRVDIDASRCGSCRMCATFCPTGAIRKFADPDGTFGIEHHPSLCVKCRCCEQICSTGALTLHDDVTPREIAGDEGVRFSMAPLSFVPGDLQRMHERVSTLIGVEECYDH